MARLLRVGFGSSSRSDSRRLPLRDAASGEGEGERALIPWTVSAVLLACLPFPSPEERRERGFCSSPSELRRIGDGERERESAAVLADCDFSSGEGRLDLRPVRDLRPVLVPDCALFPSGKGKLRPRSVRDFRAVLGPSTSPGTYASCIRSRILFFFTCSRQGAGK